MNDYRDWFYSRYSVALGYRDGGDSTLQRSFTQFHARWRRWLAADKNIRVLDVGCGNGEFLLYLRSMRYESLEGVDLDPAQVERANAGGLKGVVCTTVQNFLVDKQSDYDLISAFNFFEHVTKAELLEILAAMHRALKPGGRIIAVTPNGVSVFSGTTRYWDFSHEQSFTPASWRQLARVTGFGEPVFQEYGPLKASLLGVVRCILWVFIKLAIDAVSFVEVGRSRDASRVYTADMKIILTKSR
jgi:cyclopropane fatty-acyl-phospholipid synthase-like methyltransferase